MRILSTSSRRVLLLASFFMTLTASPLASAAEWTPSGEQNGVQLYSKQAGGDALKYFRGVTRVKAPLKKVLAALLDRETFPEWFHNMREDVTLPDDNPDASLCYIWMKGVWPTADRDTVARATVSQDAQTGVISIIVRSAEQHRVPLKKGRVRMPELYTGFFLRALSPHETEIQLEGQADPGGSIPSFLTNAVASDLPAKTLANLRARLETPDKVDLGVLDKVPFAVLSMKKIQLPEPGQ